MDLYELLASQRPTHWFKPPTIVRRQSGMEIILYPDVIVDMFGFNMEKMINHVSRTDMTDDGLLTFLKFAHGTSPEDPPCLPSGDAQFFDSLRSVKLNLDLCNQAFQCGIDAEDEAFNHNTAYNIGVELSKLDEVTRLWNGEAPELSADELRSALGLTQCLRIGVAFALSPNPMHRLMQLRFERSDLSSLLHVPTANSPIPPDYVLVEVGSEGEAMDEDDAVFDKKDLPDRRYLIHAPTLWSSWRYIRRMYSFGGPETESRHVILPTDFPRKLFVLLLGVMFGFITGSNAVHSLTPRHVAYVKEHAGEFDLVDADGTPAPHMDGFMDAINVYDWKWLKLQIQIHSEENTSDAVDKKEPGEL
jgi:hypothetical protein